MDALSDCVSVTIHGLQSSDLILSSFVCMRSHSIDSITTLTLSISASIYLIVYTRFFRFHHHEWFLRSSCMFLSDLFILRSVSMFPQSFCCYALNCAHSECFSLQHRYTFLVPVSLSRFVTYTLLQMLRSSHSHYAHPTRFYRSSQTTLCHKDSLIWNDYDPCLCFHLSS